MIHYLSIDRAKFISSNLDNLKIKNKEKFNQDNFKITLHIPPPVSFNNQQTTKL